MWCWLAFTLRILFIYCPSFTRVMLRSFFLIFVCISFFFNHPTHRQPHTNLHQWNPDPSPIKFVTLNCVVVRLICHMVWPVSDNRTGAHLGSSSRSRRADRDREYLGSFSRGSTGGREGDETRSESPGLSSSLLSLDRRGTIDMAGGSPGSTEDLSMMSNRSSSPSLSNAKRNSTVITPASAEPQQSVHHQEHNKS